MRRRPQSRPGNIKIKSTTSIQDSVLVLLLIFYLLSHLLFAGCNEEGRGDAVEGGAPAAACKKTRREETSAEELAAAKMAEVKAAVEKDVDKGPLTNRWMSVFDIVYRCLPLAST